MPARIPHRDYWTTFGHLVHTIATQGFFMIAIFHSNSTFPTTLLVYCSAIYILGMTLKYGLGGWLESDEMKCVRLTPYTPSTCKHPIPATCVGES